MELGSNFEIDFSNLTCKKDHIFHYLRKYHSIYTDSGRSASTILRSMLKLEKGTVLLPAYICGSVIDRYKDCSIVFYRINKDFSIDLQDLEQKLNPDVKAVYLMHYFGKLQEEKCLKFLAEKREQYRFWIIEDTTHSLFSNPCTIGDYCIASLRKWFPIPDGGVLYTKHELDRKVIGSYEKKNPSAVLEAMVLKKWYIRENIPCNLVYRKIFTDAEKELDDQKQVFLLSDISRSILECISISEMSERRRDNYRQLNENIENDQAVNDKIGSVYQTMDFVPLAYPVYVEDRDAFRRYLMEKQVYCAVHWPLEGTLLENDEGANAIFSYILSLPVDQRYDRVHMEYLVKTIQKYVKTMIQE